MQDYIEWDDFVTEVARDSELEPIISETNVYNPPPFWLLLAISHQHLMRDLLIANDVLNPKDTDHTNYFLIYVTLDTTFRDAIHANPDHLTMYLRNSIEIVELCDAANILTAPKIDATLPAKPHFLQSYMDFLNSNVVGRTNCKTYPPMALVNFLHDKKHQLGETLNEAGLKIPNCHMVLPNDIIRTFEELYHLSNIVEPYPNDNLDNLEHNNAYIVKTIWKQQHVHTNGLILKPLYGTFSAHGVVFVKLQGNSLIVTDANGIQLNVDTTKSFKQDHVQKNWIPESHQQGTSRLYH